MNNADFDAWLDDYAEAFPETAAWLNGFGEDSTPRILARWQAVFTDRRVGLADAKAATAAMLAGRSPAIAAYEREQTPARVAAIARKIADDRTRVAPAEVDEPQRAVGVGGLFREIVGARKAGATPEQIEALIVARFGDHGDDRRSRYRCLRCRDTGVVTVLAIASTKQLERVAAGEPCGTAAAACDCREADAWQRTAAPLARYSDAEHVLAAGPGSRQDRATALLERKEAAGRVAAFDHFNEPEAAAAF